MTSNYVMVSIKLCLDVGNGEYITLCNCGGCIMSGFEVIEGGPPKPLPLPSPSPAPVAGSKKKKFPF